MSTLLDPVSLEDQPIDRQGIGTNDFVLKVLDHIIGRVVAKHVTGGRLIWFWMLTGIHLPIQLQPSHGATGTEIDSTAALEAKFRAWLDWAKSRGEPVRIG